MNRFLSLWPSWHCVLLVHALGASFAPFASCGIAATNTSLTDKSIQYTVAKTHYVRMERHGVIAIVVDNAAGDADASVADVPELSEHRAGYSGLAYLGRREHKQNLFVPRYAGLNFEHIHDGDKDRLVEKFEPRRAPMELRVVDEHTVELYQAATPHFQLESCGRYHILADGTIQYTFECISRADRFSRGFIGLFWASYIHAPEDKAIFIRGRAKDQPDAPTRWIRAVTPQHGVLAGHAPATRVELPDVDPDFPLTLVNHPSNYVSTEPWYYGVNNGFAYVQMFNARDHIWIVQSPSGGGAENPAWDFQYFSPAAKVGEVYGFTMRAGYIPFQSPEQVERFARPHLKELNIDE